RRRRKSEGGQKFLPPNPLPFCPPELKSFSKFSVRIFAKKSSDFVQRSEPGTIRFARVPGTAIVIFDNARVHGKPKSCLIMIKF
ncbi:MAG: hypothetical protein V1928_00095, partial [Parcubacteria group bacterium]